LRAAARATVGSAGSRANLEGRNVSVFLAEVRFLVVDDNVHMLNIVKTILRGFGATRVSEARNAREALARLRHQTIDIVILDYLMDGERRGLPAPAPSRRRQPRAFRAGDHADRPRRQGQGGGRPRRRRERVLRQAGHRR
jgi:hypothetical protein